MKFDHDANNYLAEHYRKHRPLPERAQYRGPNPVVVALAMVVGITLLAVVLRMALK